MHDTRERTYPPKQNSQVKQYDVARRYSRCRIHHAPLRPPPKFKGNAEDDLEDWLRVYDRYAKALAWSGDQKADNLVVVLKQ